MINLILNAKDALIENLNGKITLSAKTDDNKRAIIQVKDNGCGIEKDILDKIFIPFFSTKHHGAGIGLNLCKQIMILHRGSIYVQSILGKGAIFTLQF